ncbi:ABC transporter ATP-binding protein [Enemella evansiae]|uniref:ABC transporter ATP-binding protein n=1 Tax=Enemella evansiae TaxID=2016499 RepID=UPI000B971DC2|nr:oligopeptide/dipeptide ABC transporter ATP-binding protein [Enemella evansiae]OYN96964.1 peptide ABC transporter ATP-binding protein [Enemella evansiae]OYO06194.1 peptide ABC transporter ATP-binding protein [Enemella evansiae]OYO11882.1 peptide ABC transporter ATP-binding protein [Enemella evansiae]PFG68925.1 peptide/nickel transport system ATP-binding protein [Propionibacteriaceae bacterium ES.041]
MSRILELTDVTRHFGPVRAADGVNLHIDEGEILGLVGESGSGKSTIGRLAVRLDEPTSGTITFKGTDITALSARRLRPLRRDFNLVFQDPSSSLDPRMTNGEIIAEPLQHHRIGDATTRRQRVSELIARVGLRPEVAELYPHQLSGGMRQRISLARALATDPALVVADEPTSALDVSVQAAVLNLLTDLQRELGFASLFITHDLSAVEFLANRVAVMYLGTIVETGPTAALMADPLHPYTQALLSAAPVPDPDEQRTRQRIVVSGDLPSPADPPPGCRFHTRCPIAVDRCRTEVPLLRSVGERQVACHLVSDDGVAPRLIAPERTTASKEPR